MALQTSHPFSERLYRLFTVCPTLLDMALLAEMATNSYSVFLSQKWWCQCKTLQGWCVTTLSSPWAICSGPAGLSWLCSKPAWPGMGGVFPFLRKWPDQCYTQTHPLARSFPPIGPLSKHTWVQVALMEKKKRMFLEHQSSADKWRGAGQIHTIKIVSRGHLLLEPCMI